MTSTGPSPELKERLLAAVQAEPAPTQRTVRRRGWLMLGIAAGIAVAIFAHFGGIRVQGRPGPLVLWTCLGWSVAACVAAAVAVARGGSTAGRSTGLLLVLVGAAPVALLGWKIAVTVAFDPQLMAPWPGRFGFRCLGLSIAMAVPLLVALFVLRRGSDPVHPGVTGAALGITAGLVAGSLVDLWCPVAEVSHLLLGHILPLVAAAACGAWAGRRLLPP